MARFAADRLRDRGGLAGAPDAAAGAVPAAINATRATCEIQFGAVERPTHRNTSWDWARFEVCAHRWVDLSEGGLRRGAAERRQVRPQPAPQHAGALAAQGRDRTPTRTPTAAMHRFTYSLLPHAGDWRAAEVMRRAYELNAPLAWQRERERRTMTDEPSVSPFIGSVVLRSCPRRPTISSSRRSRSRQDGDGLIVRLYEAHNQRGPASCSSTSQSPAQSRSICWSARSGRSRCGGEMCAFGCGRSRSKPFACGWPRLTNTTTGAWRLEIGDWDGAYLNLQSQKQELFFPT